MERRSEGAKERGSEREMGRKGEILDNSLAGCRQEGLKRI